MGIPFPPSQEQQAVVDAFIRGDDLAVQAGAGTGKSTTLAFIAQAQRQHRPGATAWYITFNKRNAEEVQETFTEFGLTNAKASTAHSLANRTCRADPALRHWVERLGGDKNSMRIGDEMRLLGIGESSRILDSFVHEDLKTGKFRIGTPDRDPGFKVQKRFLSLTRKTVEKFCQSGDTAVNWSHVPYLPDLHEQLRKHVSKALVESGQRMWDELSNPNSPLPTGHSHYLKAWALSNPVIGNPGDVLLYDEAQDANAVLAGAVVAQKGRVQLALVGDLFQQIYAFTGSIPAIRDFGERDDVTELPLTECRRFGPAIAAEANAVLNRLDPARNGIRLVGVGPEGGFVQHTYTDADTHTVTAVVARSNAKVIEHIMNQVAAGRLVHSTIDIRSLERLASDVELVLAGRASEAKDPLLCGFTDLTMWEHWLEDEEPENEELRDQVKAVIKYGIEQIKTLSQVLVKDAEKADVTVSTIHKAKGATWDSVLVDMGEFPIKDEDEDQLRLLYVALTRARYRVLWNPPQDRDDESWGGSRRRWAA